MSNLLEYSSRTACHFLEQKIDRLNKQQRQNWAKHIERLMNAVLQDNTEMAAIHLMDVMGIVDLYAKARVGQAVEVDEEEDA